MGFFDAVRVPPPPSPPSYRLPEWVAPPENARPGRLAVDVVLVDRPPLRLTIATLGAYPCGVRFELACEGSTRSAREHPFFGGAALFDGGLGFGLLFADGRRAIANERTPRRPLLRRPDAPTLRAMSGGSAPGGWRTSFWLWPLPPPGPLEFVCEWGLEGVAETGAAIDGALVVDAASRARELWPERRELPPTEGDVVI